MKTYRISFLHFHGSRQIAAVLRPHFLQLFFSFLLVLGIAAEAASIRNIRVRRDNSPLTEGRLFQPPPGPDGVKFDMPSNTLWFGYLKKNGRIVVDRTTGNGYATPDMGLQGQADGTGDYELMLRLKGFPDSNKLINFSVRNRIADPLPVFTQQPPEFQEATVGDAAAFQAAATNAVRWQWYFEGSPIAGATSSTLTLASVSKANGGSYYAVAFNGSNMEAESEQSDLTVVSPLPVITEDPESFQQVPPGSTVSFRAAAINAARWEWYFNSEQIFGADSSTLTLRNITKASAGFYYAIAYNEDESNAQTSEAELAVVSPLPVITEDPEPHQQVPPGSTVAFRAAAINAVRWEWYFNSKQIFGADSSTLTLRNVTKASAGSYHAVAYNEDEDNVETSEAELAVISPLPVITEDPARHQQAPPGGTVAFRAAAINVVRWEWYFDGEQIFGADSSTLTLRNITKASAGSYYAVAYNEEEQEAQSNSAELAVVSAPKITKQPAPITVNAGDFFTLSIETDDSDAEFQWKKDDVVLEDETGNSLTREEAEAGDAGSYVCTVSNAAGSVTSNAAKVAVQSIAPPAITRQPASLRVASHGSAVFRVRATGSGELSYQWFWNGEELDAHGDTLTIDDATRDEAGRYHVVVSNAGGSVKSTAARLTVENKVRAGQYAGLFYTPGEVLQEARGSIKLSATSAGRFTGSARMGAARYAFAGQFNAEGSAAFQAKSAGRNAEPLDVVLTVNGEDRIEGSAAIGRLEAEAQLDRAVFSSKEPCPLAQACTILLPPDESNSETPQSHGYLAATIAADGTFAATGKLADGSAVSVRAIVSGEGNVALYIPLYSGKGSLFGWLNVDGERVSGLVSWIKPAAASGSYPNGFATAMESLGGVYDKSRPALPDEAVLILAGATLPDPIEITLQARPGNKIATGRNGASVHVKKNGSFSGSIVNRETGQPLSFSGVFDQASQTGCGFFLAGGQSGNVYIGEALESELP